ncbi:hypothetical protein [Stenotrophomonas sp. CFBP 13725]|uniref:hypothetical protein n=1 Tax=Stenotrophomonas sp. CFBP 13725 TaxID=2775297 RepID=UPI0017800CB3|nr:hypothetical protein [Stenotrophomonas sp. CFBP 13725]MBD8637418.1 hypothetical protein [Stenotrophomonas sp. CFBP 13725]
MRSEAPLAQARCASQMTFSVSCALHDGLGGLAGRAVSGVGNLPLPVLPAALQNEMRAVLHGAGRELIHWGTVLGFSRAVQQAERLIPGVSLPYQAYQLFSALSAAGRGQILSALQQLPFSALVPAQVLQALAESLRRITGERLPAHGDIAPIVLGLAVCALLCASQRPAMSPPQTAPGRALVAGIGWLRVLAGLHAALPPATASGRTRAAGRTVAFVPAHHNATGLLRVGTTGWPALPSLAGGRAAPTWTEASAWPLQGVEAGVAKVKVKVPVKLPRPASQAGSGRTGAAAPPGRSRTTHHRRWHARPDGRLGSDGRGAVDPQLPPWRPQGVVGQQPPHAKESTAVAKQAIAHGTKSGHPAMNRNARLTPAPPSAGLRAILPTNASMPLAPPDTAAPPAEPSGEPLSCLRFHDIDEARLQVGKMRFLPLQPAFCVPPDTRADFLDGFDAAPSSRDAAASWMKFHAVHEDLAAAQRRAGASKYFGLGQIERAEPRDATALGDDALYALMTVSVLKDGELQRRQVTSAQVLARNSFRLLQHRAPSGLQKTFLVFFINAAASPCRGARAGFLEVTAAADGEYAVHDEVAGFGLSGSSLDALVEGAQKMSGCRFEATPLPAAGSSGSEEADLAVPARHLFVREQSTWCGNARYMPQVLNDDLPFFIARSVHVPGQADPTILYRNSFSLGTDILVHMDEHGQVGALPLQLSTSVPGRVMLRSPESAVTRRLMGLHDLHDGDQYLLLDLIERFERGGMSWIPGAMAAPCRQQDDVEVSGQAIACALMPATTDRPASPPAPPPRSLFVWADDEVRYVDHDGTPGTLYFLRSGMRARNLVLAPENDEDTLDFARRNDLRPHTRYAEDEVLWLLKGEGFERIRAETSADADDQSQETA